jgi:hypothetical protein
VNPTADAQGLSLHITETDNALDPDRELERMAPAFRLAI